MPNGPVVDNPLRVEIERASGLKMRTKQQNDFASGTRVTAGRILPRTEPLGTQYAARKNVQRRM
jgi:hypothetical protein